MAELFNSIDAIVFRTYHWGIGEKRKRVIGRNSLSMLIGRGWEENVGVKLCAPYHNRFL